MQVNLDDLKLAFQISVNHSLSKTSEELGVSNATIIRRLDRLESALGVKLFIRHPRGYKPTDAGKMLHNEFPTLLNQAELIKNKICHQQEINYGILNVTLLPEVSTQIGRALKEYRLLHPEIRLSIHASDEIQALNQGDFHVALRAGKICHAPDLIVKELYTMQYAYYASTEYVNRFGMPEAESDYNNFEWVMPSGKKVKISFIKKIFDKLHPSNISYQCNNLIDIESAVQNTMGIGPIEVSRAKEYDNLIHVPSCGIDENNSLFFVFHKDLKESRKVNSFYQHLKSHIQKSD